MGPDDDDDLLNPAAAAVPGPVAPVDKDALRAQLYAGLQARLNGPDAALAANQKDVGDETRRNALLVALNQSANQAGSVGGKIAESSGPKGTADAIAGAGQSDLADQGQQVAQKQKVQDYLMGQLQKSDQFAAAQTQRAQERQDALASAEKLKGMEETGKIKAAQIMADGRQTVNQDSIDAGKYGGGAGGAAKADMKVNERFTKLGHDINSGLASSRSDMGKQQGTVSSADRVLALGSQGDLQQGGLDNRQIHELAIASAGLVSGGSTGAAQGTIDALVPHSSGSVESRVEEWLTSNPTGANQQQFVKRMLETAEREKSVASEKIKGYKAEVLDSFSDLASSNPDRYNQIKAKALGDNAQFDKNGSYVQQAYKPPEAAAPAPAAGTAMAGTSGKVDSKITDYATQHGLDYGTARSLLVGRGYTPSE